LHHQQLSTLFSLVGRAVVTVVAVAVARVDTGLLLALLLLRVQE
jgi:hypothetical protein